MGRAMNRSIASAVGKKNQKKVRCFIRPNPADACKAREGPVPGPPEATLVQEAFFLGGRGIGGFDVGEGLLGGFLALHEVGQFIAERGVHQPHVG